LRIAIICHINHEFSGLKYLISLLADRWAAEGHHIEFVSGYRGFRPADLALLHVDLSVVPRKYVSFARQYPIVLNNKILDIRKSRISPNLVGPNSNYLGQVIMKTDLNAGGYPEYACEWYPVKEQRTHMRLWRKLKFNIFGAEPPPMPGKQYQIFDNIKKIPKKMLSRPGYVIEKFFPEIQDGLYFTRRCYVLGNRAITHRMGNPNPLGGGFAPVFEWIDNSAEILNIAKSFRLDYGAIDYTVCEGEANFFDINKTLGVDILENEEVRKNIETIVNHLAPGIRAFRREF
jgi:hypothetical protein